MTKLEKVFENLTSHDGTSIDVKNIKKISLSVDLTDDKNFAVLAWEARKGSKTYTLELPRKHFADIANELMAYKYVIETVEDIFEDKTNKSDSAVKAWGEA